MFRWFRNLRSLFKKSKGSGTLKTDKSVSNSQRLDPVKDLSVEEDSRSDCGSDEYSRGGSQRNKGYRGNRGRGSQGNRGRGHEQRNGGYHGGQNSTNRTVSSGSYYSNAEGSTEYSASTYPTSSGTAPSTSRSYPTELSESTHSSSRNFGATSSTRSTSSSSRIVTESSILGTGTQENRPLLYSEALSQGIPTTSTSTNSMSQMSNTSSSRTVTEPSSIETYPHPHKPHRPNPHKKRRPNPHKKRRPNPHKKHRPNPHKKHRPNPHKPHRPHPDLDELRIPVQKMPTRNTSSDPTSQMSNTPSIKRNNVNTADIQGDLSPTNRVDDVPYYFYNEMEKEYENLKKSWSGVWNEGFPKGLLVMYTDGSYNPNNPQSGIGIFVAPQHQLNRSLRLKGKNQTSDYSEFMAVQTALSNACEGGEYRNTHRIVIRTDSMNLIGALSGTRITEYQHEQNRIQELAKQFKMGVVFQHVHAHCGDPGNAIADLFAYYAGFCPNCIGNFKPNSSLSHRDANHKLSKSNDHSLICSRSWLIFGDYSGSEFNRIYYYVY